MPSHLPASNSIIEWVPEPRLLAGHHAPQVPWRRTGPQPARTQPSDSLKMPARVGEGHRDFPPAAELARSPLPRWRCAPSEDAWPWARLPPAARGAKTSRAQPRLAGRPPEMLQVAHRPPPARLRPNAPVAPAFGQGDHPKRAASPAPSEPISHALPAARPTAAARAPSRSAIARRSAAGSHARRAEGVGEEPRRSSCRR
jgi:hypothetical protein